MHSSVSYGQWDFFGTGRGERVDDDDYTLYLNKDIIIEDNVLTLNNFVAEDRDEKISS